MQRPHLRYGVGSRMTPITDVMSCRILAKIFACSFLHPLVASAARFIIALFLEDRGEALKSVTIKSCALSHRFDR